MDNSDNMLPEQRRQRLLDIIEENYTARCSELSERLNVSEMTIRRDLIALEKEGKVKRTHGGAIFRHELTGSEFRYKSNKKVNVEEKKKIAARAVEFIEAHDVIFIGEGTTPSLMFHYVDPNLPFTVYTNNYGIANEISDKKLTATFNLLGGTYNPDTCSTSGSMTLEMIGRINADKVFLGVDAFSLRSGMTTSNPEFEAVNRAMIRKTTGEVIILSDHTKFGMVETLEIAKPKEIDILVTNIKLSEQFSDGLTPYNIRVVDASNGNGSGIKKKGDTAPSKKEHKDL